MKLWHRFQLWRHTRRARYLKAKMLAYQSTIKENYSTQEAEAVYLLAVIEVKTYQMLINPSEMPKATANKAP